MASSQYLKQLWSLVTPQAPTMAEARDAELARAEELRRKAALEPRTAKLLDLLGPAPSLETKAVPVAHIPTESVSIPTQVTVTPELPAYKGVDMGGPEAGIRQLMSRIENYKPSPETVALREEAEKRGREAIDAQKGGVSELEDTINQLKNMEKGVDLTPLLALSDTWGGTKLLSSYKGPKSEEEKLKELAAVQSQLAQRKGDIAKEEFAMAKGRANEHDELGRMKLMLGAQTGLAGIERARETGERFQTALEEKQRQKEDNDVRAFSDRMEKSGMSVIPEVLTNIEYQLGKYKGKDIPGYGATGWVPSIMTSEGGKDVRQAVDSLRNTLLKIKSGSAVTDSEARRLYDELGTSIGQSDEQLRRGIQNASNFLRKQHANITAGAAPRIKEEYSKRGGTLDFPSMGSSYTNKEERGIEAVMQRNGITREQAINALKKGGKLR